MADYHHGVRVIKQTDGARPIRTIATGVIGIVGTAPDADSDTFPLNTPVLIPGSEQKAAELDTQGDGKGTLPRAVRRGIFQQGAPAIVVVRVEEGADDTETTAKVIGEVKEDGQHTGLQALLVAQTKVGMKPRILGAPGVDTKEVATELERIAEKLRGFYYVGADGASTAQDAISYAEDLAPKRGLVIWPDWEYFSVTHEETRTLEGAAVALGLRAQIDSDTGWHKVLSNVPVSGVTGITKDVEWDLQDPDTQANQLNKAGVTTLIQSNGFRFWGSRIAGGEPMFPFESAVRTGQIIADTIGENHLWAVDKPMSKTLFEDIAEGVNRWMARQIRAGRLVGAEAWLDPEKNTKDSLAQGIGKISYNYTPPPPLEDLQFIQTVTDEYLVQLVE